MLCVVGHGERCFCCLVVTRVPRDLNQLGAVEFGKTAHRLTRSCANKILPSAVLTRRCTQIASVSQAAGSSAGASVGATAVQLSVRELDLTGSLSAIQRLRSASCSVRRPLRHSTLLCLAHVAPANVLANAVSSGLKLPSPIAACWGICECKHLLTCCCRFSAYAALLVGAGSLLSALWWLQHGQLGVVSQGCRSPDSTDGRAGGGVAALGADRHGEQRRRQHAGRGDARGTGLPAAGRRVRRVDGHLPRDGLQAAHISRCS